RFRGLCLFEQGSHDLTVHLVDGSKLGLPEHVPQLTLDAKNVDKKASFTPKPSEVEHTGLAEIWHLDLRGSNVEGPATTPPDLAFAPSPATTAVQPETTAGWRSLHWVPDLAELAGATRIMRRDAFSSSISLTHGEFESMLPGDVGTRCVW